MTKQESLIAATQAASAAARNQDTNGIRGPVSIDHLDEIAGRGICDPAQWAEQIAVTLASAGIVCGVFRHLYAGLHALHTRDDSLITRAAEGPELKWREYHDGVAGNRGQLVKTLESMGHLSFQAYILSSVWQGWRAGIHETPAIGQIVIASTAANGAIVRFTGQTVSRLVLQNWRSYEERAGLRRLFGVTEPDPADSALYYTEEEFVGHVRHQQSVDRRLGNRR